METKPYKVMILIERTDVGGEGPPSFNGQDMYGAAVIAGCYAQAKTLPEAITISQKLFHCVQDSPSIN